MFIFVAAGGKVSLRDSDNMRAFSIVEEQPGSAAVRLAGIANAAGENHYWLDAAVVIELSGRQDDAQWVAAFWDMLAMAEAYGYSDMTEKRVKAHVGQG